MSVAAKVALHKEKHPGLYCPADRCLWRTNGGFCPRHTPEKKAATVICQNCGQAMDPVLEADGEQRWRHRGSCEGAKVVSGYYVCPVLYQWGIYSVATGARMALYSTREAAQADLQRYAPQKENGAE